MTIETIIAPREREWKHIFQGVQRWEAEEAQAIYAALYPYTLTSMQKRGYRNVSKDTPKGLMQKNFVDVRERSSLFFSTENLLDSNIVDRRILKCSRDFCVKAGADPTNRIEMETMMGRGGSAKARRRLDRMHDGAVTQIFSHVGVYPGELRVADMCDIQRYIFRVGFYVSLDGLSITPPDAPKPKNSNFVALTICLDQGDVPMKDNRGWRILGQMDREEEIETYKEHDRHESEDCPITDPMASGLQIEAAKHKVVALMQHVTPQHLLATRVASPCSKLGRARQIRLGQAGTSLKLVA